jgi:hypothetical protein
MWLLGAAALALLAPAQALAAPAHVYVSNTNEYEGKVCVDGTTHDAVTFVLRAPDGQVLDGPNTADALSTACDGGGGIGFAANLGSLSGRHYPAGAIATATQDGVSVSFVLPYAIRNSLGDSTNDLRVRGLPDPASVRIKSVLDPTTVTGGNYDNPSIVSADRNVQVTATVPVSSGGQIPYEAVVDPDRFAISISDRDVSINGLDPAGSPALAVLYASDGTTALDEVALRPRIGMDTQATATFDQLPPANAVVKVSQAGWFSHTVVAGAASIGSGGFSASGPSGQTVAGVPETVSLDASLAFAPGASFCPGFAASLSCAAGNQFVVPGDSVTVTATSPYGDRFATTATRSGSTGSLDDGSYYYDAGVPNQRGTVTFSNPPASKGAEPYVEDGDPVSSDADGFVDVSYYFGAHVANLATVTPRGAVFGSTRPPAFRFDLAYKVSGNTVSGTTYAGARVLVTATRGILTNQAQLVADGSGAFSATFSDLRVGDEIDVVAAEPNTHDTTTSTTYVGALQPTIAGVSDGDAVRGTIHPAVSGVGIDRVVWSGDFFPANIGAPFVDTIDTTKYDDGYYRLEATALPSPSATDYLYLVVDNTPPNGSAGPAQTVAPGRKVVFVTGASDDTSGLASVTLRPGDGSKLFRQADADLGLPMYHFYRKTGTYTATVTITDAAGNRTVSKTRIVVTNRLSAQVAGVIPTTVAHGHAMTARLRSGTTGDLSFMVLAADGTRLARNVVHFMHAGHRVAATFATASLPPGRYTVVLQFTSDRGGAGPVVVRTLTVT